MDENYTFNKVAEEIHKIPLPDFVDYFYEEFEDGR